MDSVKSPQSDRSSKSKKKIAHQPPHLSNQKVSGPDPDPWSVKTPGKPADPPRRLCNRSAALSLKEVRQAARKLCERGTDPPIKPDPLARSDEAELNSKMTRKSKKKADDDEVKLPEKYEMLDKFFSSLESSIRLLKMRRSATTFMNISDQIQLMTDRRVSHSHLAQLKYIMPEAIEIKKTLVFDESTHCMKPDLSVTLNATAVETDQKSKSVNGNLQLRKVFRSRLVDFFKSHPEGDEVPEEVLPEPFPRVKQHQEENFDEALDSSSRNDSDSVALPEGHLAAASLLPISWKKSFSRKGSSHSIEPLKQDQTDSPSHASVVLGSNLDASVARETKAYPPKSPLGSRLKASTNMKPAPHDASAGGSPLSPLPKTPSKSNNEEGCSSIETSTMARTPSAIASTPAKLMTATPVLQAPKRCYMSPSDDSNKTPSKLVRRPPANRPLKFDTPVKCAKIENEFSGKGKWSIDDDIFDILPESLLESIREKERRAILEQDPAISQAKWRQKMLAGLPKLFDMVYFLFQSINRSIITKEELLHKIIGGHVHIVDRREVEDQLKLLQELAPEWIYEKLASSGDTLICVNKISAEVTRARLAEAK